MQKLTSRQMVLALVAISVLIALVVWVAPDELVLGDGIRLVYLHVAATWAGMLGFVLAAVLGLVLLVKPVPIAEKWFRPVCWTAFAMFTTGFVMSLLAAWVNWGGVLWGEPRTIASLKVIAIALGVLVVSGKTVSGQWKGALWILLTAYVFWTLGRVQPVLHPENAIRTSTSFTIRASFYGLFAGTLIASGLVAELLRRRRTKELRD